MVKEQTAVRIPKSISPHREPFARQRPVQLRIFTLGLTREALNRSSSTTPSTYNEVRVVERLELEEVFRFHVMHVLVLVDRRNTHRAGDTSEGAVQNAFGKHLGQKAHELQAAWLGFTSIQKFRFWREPNS